MSRHLAAPTCSGVDTIARYLLFIHGDGAEPDVSHAGLLGFLAKAVVFHGELHDTDTATVVEESDGKILMTDGPVAGHTTSVTGILVIDADNLDTALGSAARLTAAIGNPIEVRPLRDDE